MNKNDLEKPIGRISDQQGSVLLIAVIVLALLSLLGIMSTTTTSIELQIAGNERIYRQNFNCAEAGARHVIELIQSTDKSDLDNHESLNWLTNGMVNPSTIPDFTDPGAWDWDDSDGDANAEELTVTDADGDPVCSETYFAAVEINPAAESLLGETGELRQYRGFGYYNHPQRGEVLIEVGIRLYF